MKAETLLWIICLMKNIPCLELLCPEYIRQIAFFELKFHQLKIMMKKQGRNMLSALAWNAAEQEIFIFATFEFDGFFFNNLHESLDKFIEILNLITWFQMISIWWIYQNWLCCHTNCTQCVDDPNHYALQWALWVHVRSDGIIMTSVCTINACNNVTSNTPINVILFIIMCILYYALTVASCTK